jgi:recombination protein RecR
LPGIGKKSALRLALHLLRQSQSQGLALGNAIQNWLQILSIAKNVIIFLMKKFVKFATTKKKRNSLHCRR